MLRHQIAKHNQKIYEEFESYKKEQEAKQEFFWKLGEQVITEFYGATVEDVFQFADQLKEWAIQAEFQPSGVEKTGLREKFFRSKFE